MFQSLKANRFSYMATLFIGGVLWFFSYVENHHAWQLTLIACMGLSAYISLHNYRRLLKITEAPISTIAAAAQGYIELQGTTSTINPYKTPFLEIPCVWYRVWVYADRRDDPLSNQVTDARLLEYVESDQVFQLSDRTGTCMVNPKGAEIIYVQKREGRKNEHRYVEEYLPVGKPLYVLGYLDTRHAYLSPELVNFDTKGLLTSWKESPSKLLARFDQNRNDELDLREWELARAEARREVIAQHQIKASNRIYTLSKPLEKQLFLISALSPQDLRKSLRIWSAFHFVLVICFLFAIK